MLEERGAVVKLRAAFKEPAPCPSEWVALAEEVDRLLDLSWLARCLLRFGTPVAGLKVPLPWLLPRDDGPGKSSRKREAGLAQGESGMAVEAGPSGPRYWVNDGLSVNAGRDGCDGSADR